MLISMICSFILYWLFGDIVLFISILGVGITLFILKGIKKQGFIYLEIILIALYVLLVLATVIFKGAISLKILVIILSVWFIIYVFFPKVFEENK